jgi:hypothetical protein
LKRPLAPYAETKIEELAEHKLRLDKPELTLEWDKIQHRERQATIPAIESTLPDRRNVHHQRYCAKAAAMLALPLRRTLHRQTQECESPLLQAQLSNSTKNSAAKEENRIRQNKMKKSSCLKL